jgi:hypothetical protein
MDDKSSEGTTNRYNVRSRGSIDSPDNTAIHSHRILEPACRSSRWPNASNTLPRLFCVITQLSGRRSRV